METLASQRVLLCNGSCISSVDAIHPVQTSVHTWTKGASHSIIQKSKTFLRRKATQCTQQVLTTLVKMVRWNANIEHSPTQYKRFFLVRTWMSNFGHVHSIMHFACPTRSRNRLDRYPQLPSQLASKKTSPTSEPLAVEFGFGRQGIATPSFVQTPTKVCSLAVCRTQHATFSGVTLRPQRSRSRHMPASTKA